MTTPKDPHDNADSPDKAELYDSIDELENLISSKAPNVNGENKGPVIPVLDDVIDPETTEFDDDDDYYDLPDMDHEDTAEDLPQNQFTPDQVDKLINTMDEKLSGELDALVNILKDAIKESIITEIKSQLDSQTQKDQPAKTDGDPTT